MNPQHDPTAGTLVDALTKYGDDAKLIHLGREMFRLYTEKGFPPDMFLDELEKRDELEQDQLIVIVATYQSAFIEHRRVAGAEEKNLDKARDMNRRIMEAFIKTGELGIY